MSECRWCTDGEPYCVKHDSWSDDGGTQCLASAEFAVREIRDNHSPCGFNNPLCHCDRRTTDRIAPWFNPCHGCGYQYPCPTIRALEGDFDE